MTASQLYEDDIARSSILLTVNNEQKAKELIAFYVVKQHEDDEQDLREYLKDLRKAQGALKKAINRERSDFTQVQVAISTEDVLTAQPISQLEEQQN